LALGTAGRTMQRVPNVYVGSRGTDSTGYAPLPETAYSCWPILGWTEPGNSGQSGMKQGRASGLPVGELGREP
jgi:hypothetical protein